MSVAASMRRRHLGHGRNDHDFGLFFIKRSVTPAAQIVSGPELNEQAVVATNDFP
jgi:hypothetical protein